MEKISLEVDEQTKNLKTKKSIWIVIIGVVIFCVAIFVVLSIGLGSTPKQKLSVSSTNLTVDYDEYLGYSAKITGVAKNVTNHDFSYASVEFSVYDTNGNNLGTAIANINNLAAGDTWHFEATLINFPSTKPTTYKLAEITAW